MDNYYEHAKADWVTDWSRYEAVLAEPRFADLRELSVSALAPEQAYDLVRALLQSVPDDTVHYVGSGPLEELIHVHGAALIDRIDVDLRTDDRLRRAMLEINLDRGILPPIAEARLVSALGPSFSLLEPPPPNER